MLDKTLKIPGWFATESFMIRLDHISFVGETSGDSFCVYVLNSVEPFHLLARCRDDLLKAIQDHEALKINE